MINNLLLDKMKILQEEYLELLKKLLTKFNSPDFLLVIDEVNTFWFSKRKMVNLILDNISKSQDCYVLMAATFLDVKDYEHFPFTCLGKMHLVDDPLSRFAKSFPTSHGQSIYNTMKEQIIMAVKDNISILENYSDVIKILPVTFLYDEDSNLDLIRKGSLQVISSMFKKEFVRESDFFNSYESYLVIENKLSDDIKDQLIFTDNDDRALSFNDRIKRYAKEYQALLPNGLGESQIFFLMIFQYISQAFDILLKCAQFNIVPYIRFDVSFQYLLIIGGNFSSTSQMSQILFRSMIAHTLYQVFNKEKIFENNFEGFTIKLNSYDFDNKVFTELKKQNINLDNYDLRMIVDILKKHLSYVY